MTAADLPGVLAIERTSFSSPWSIQCFQSELSSHYAYPIVVWQPEEPRVLGYLCSWIVLGECHLLNLAVHPERRRRGLATHLLDFLFRICRRKSVHDYYLEVRRSNTVAISLYRKHGFTMCGVRRGYYTDTREDAIVMRRRDRW
jgi:ribosomal-protein-alanine N-acetyltransferase